MGDTLIHRGTVEWNDQVPHEFLDLFIQTVEQSDHMEVEWNPHSSGVYDELIIKEVK